MTPIPPTPINPALITDWEAGLFLVGDTVREDGIICTRDGTEVGRYSARDVPIDGYQMQFAWGFRPGVRTPPGFAARAGGGIWGSDPAQDNKLHWFNPWDSAAPSWVWE